MKFRTILSLGAAAVLTLSACSDGATPDAEGVVEDESASLASMISSNDDLETVTETMNDAGLTQIFDGAAFYTLLAPTDDAFEKLGTTAGATEEDQRTALVAIMRDHILPGYLTSEDIENAVEQAGGSARIQTMGEDTLTFTMVDGQIQVAGADGTTAMVLDEEGRAGNGVLLPIDGVLKQL